MTFLRRQLNSILQAYTLKTYWKGFSQCACASPFALADSHSAKAKQPAKLGSEISTVMGFTRKNNIDRNQCLLHGLKKKNTGLFNNDFIFHKEISFFLFFHDSFFPVLLKTVV